MQTTTIERPETDAPAEPDPVLAEALALLRGGWTRDEYHRPASRSWLLRALGWRDRYCVLGAVEAALDIDWDPLAGGDPRVAAACRRLGFEGTGELIAWNDFVAGGKREVLERVERAAYGL